MLQLDKNRKNAIARFIKHWSGKGYEKGDTQRFWLELLQEVFEKNEVFNFIEFEDKVLVDSTNFMDSYIPATRVLIEQKSVEKDLGKPIRQSDGTLLNPFQQAKRYIVGLPLSRHPRWIVTCNFREFWVYDMEQPNGEPQKILLQNLEKEYYRLQFLVDEGNEHLRREMEVSVKAGELVGVIYDKLLEQYTLGARTSSSAHTLGTAVEKQSSPAPNNADGDVRAPSAPIIIPQFTEDLKQLLLEKASADFDWSEISPTIFGAVFESTINPETRRNGGMHYTSIENIHKVIDQLFMNDLRAEFEGIKRTSMSAQKRYKLQAFQDKLASLTFLDPACGSGNFLTETFLSLRRLEMHYRYSNDIVYNKFPFPKPTDEQHKQIEYTAQVISLMLVLNILTVALQSCMMSYLCHPNCGKPTKRTIVR